MQSLPPAVRLKFSNDAGLSRLQNPVGFEPACGKNGETSVFFFKFGVKVSKSGILKPSLLIVYFSHECPVREDREEVSGFGRKPFVVKTISKPGQYGYVVRGNRLWKKQPQVCFFP
jgi:hypothetical protein